MFKFLIRCKNGDCNKPAETVDTPTEKPTETQQVFKKESIQKELPYLVKETSACIETFDTDGNYHSYNDEPARVCGIKKWWYEHGVKHRDVGPAYTDGPIKHWYKRGLYHNDNGPAKITDTSEVWMRNGKYYRDNGPAVQHTDGSYVYYDQNSNVTEMYRKSDELRIKCKDGVLHSLNSPAFSSGIGVRFYFINGKPVQGEGDVFKYFMSRNNYRDYTGLCQMGADIIDDPKYYTFDKK